jgi:minor extracellular serine protease Vpr
MNLRNLGTLFFPFFLIASGCIAQITNQYALILSGAPVTERFQGHARLASQSAKDYRQQIEQRHAQLRTDLASKKIAVTGSVTHVLNAVFVVAPESRVGELKALSGVTAVVPLRRYYLSLNRAVPLINAPAAWNAFGGMQNAGLGMKIALLDTGIDQSHPAFQDPSLSPPPGFPICPVPADCAFTNNKVIVARSYVNLLAAGSSPNPAVDSRPDDLSARDRVGHGTAVASVAGGVTNTGPSATITGVAPQAFLGNYKIFGSPEVNDFTTDAAIIKALDDALTDGMDVASLSLGGPAFSAPLDTGATCGNPTGVACDLAAQAVQNAVMAGMVVVAAAGNDGDSGNSVPTLNTIESPGDAPGVIAAGASTNSHVFVSSVRVPGSGVPANLQQIVAEFGDGPIPDAPLTAPLIDVTTLGDNGLACRALPLGSLNGAIALIELGACSSFQKVMSAQDAGAVGVALYGATQQPVVPPSGLANTSIPAVEISNSDGIALKAFIEANPNHPVTLDPTPVEENTTRVNLLAAFSSQGPSVGGSSVKPDLVATGTNMYMAAQNIDPLGALYSPNRYIVSNGTSFATPLTAGAAALVKQAHPAFTQAQIQSALVDTAAESVTADQFGDPVGVQSIGGGLLDTGAAVSTTLTAAPASVSFGTLTGTTANVVNQLQITNAGSSAANLSIAVAPRTADPNTTITIAPASLSLNPGATTTLSVTLASPALRPGSYDGAISIQGGANPLRIPYLYLVGSGTPANIIPLAGSGFDGTVGQPVPDGFAFKLIDQFGVPISGAPVRWTPTQGAGTIQSADAATNVYGIATAQAILGQQPGNYTFTAVAGGFSINFSGTARPAPTISVNGIVNAARAPSGTPVAPGSYISIFGTGLSDFTDSAPSATLPLAIDFAHVSFDVPSAGISVPGHLSYVSPTQVNVQVPWELQGQSSAQVKVTIDLSPGNVVTLPLATYSPAFFETSPGVIAATDANGNTISASNPALRGSTVQLYANGLGPVTNQPQTGDPASSSPLSETQSMPVVMIGGISAPVMFSGLAPGYCGLYQLNVTVPMNAAPGNDPATISISGATSTASSLAVQ